MELRQPARLSAFEDIPEVTRLAPFHLRGNRPALKIANSSLQREIGTVQQQSDLDLLQQYYECTLRCDRLRDGPA